MILTYSARLQTFPLFQLWFSFLSILEEQRFTFTQTNTVLTDKTSVAWSSLVLYGSVFDPFFLLIVIETKDSEATQWLIEKVVFPNRPLRKGCKIEQDLL